jgi:dGTPase
VWGADVSLASLNLCHETLDGIRNHSWSRPAPLTPEGEVVSWADRIAYVCHDVEDAAAAGIVSLDDLPSVVRERCGVTRSDQLNAFIAAMVDATARTGRIAMTAPTAEALAAFRTWNYERIYLREESRAQARQVIELLRALVEHYAAHPDALPLAFRVDASQTMTLLHSAVTYVSGMTDRFACSQALSLLDWDPARLPAGVDVLALR